MNFAESSHDLALEVADVAAGACHIEADVLSVGRNRGPQVAAVGSERRKGL